MKYDWSRYNGYEVSSKGDKRYSAFNAILADGRSIEEHYQCDVKGYDPGGRNWRLGKGKPPLEECDLWECYLDLWRQWAYINPLALGDLKIKLDSLPTNILSDCFANSDVNQARALATLLNERYDNE